jgi:hypothetical protein
MNLDFLAPAAAVINVDVLLAPAAVVIVWIFVSLLLLL